MEKHEKKAILAVSFGTSHNDTRKVTIDAIEHDLKEAFSEYSFYRAWTSQMIIRKLKKRDQIQIDTVAEAMERMCQDGITDILVQPTHIINGIENDQMKEDVLAYRDRFQTISFGTPLLTSENDLQTMVHVIADEFSGLQKEDALVLMGHGTMHYANSVYAALDYAFKDHGYENIFMGTVEAYPSMETLLRKVGAYKPKRVILAPFMIVAGDHAKNDMAGEEEESWRSRFQNAGYEVTAVLKGLGEYQAVRKMFVDHLRDADRR